MALVLVGARLVLFLVLKAAPADTEHQLRLGLGRADQVAGVAHAVDEPSVWSQYTGWLGGTLRGDFGKSDALQRGSGQEFTINVGFGDVARERTASGVIAERERSNLAKTREDFKQDENVKELVSLFDADIDESSIKPIN